MTATAGTEIDNEIKTDYVTASAAAMGRLYTLDLAALLRPGFAGHPERSEWTGNALRLLIYGYAQPCY